MIGKTIIESLKNGPINLYAEFGYYDYLEEMNLKLHDENNIEIFMEVETYDAYGNDKSSFNEIIPIETFLEYIKNRLSKEKTVILNKNQIDMNKFMQGVLTEIRKQSYLNKLNNEKKLK